MAWFLVTLWLKQSNMNIPFDQMPEDARVWVYAANRVLTQAEQTEITAKADVFVSGWTAHQQQLKASFIILNNVFLILAVDENHNEVSGCGIDKSIHFMQEIDKTYTLNLFNRLQIELLLEGETILTNKQKLAVMLQDGKANAQTIMFNKTITNKRDFDQQFQSALDKSWVYPGLMSQLA